MMKQKTGLFQDKRGDRKLKRPQPFYSPEELRTLHLIQKRANLIPDNDTTFVEFADRLALDCERLPLHLENETITLSNFDINAVTALLRMQLRKI
jgi:hypothetical protein